MKTSIFALTAALATAPSHCGRGLGVGEPASILPAQTLQAVVAWTDRPCAGSAYPCKAFQVPVTATGALRVSLMWEKGTNALRLELWNGENASGRCCDPGETVSVAVRRGDHPEIHIVLVTRQRPRQPFELTTSLEADE